MGRPRRPTQPNPDIDLEALQGLSGTASPGTESFAGEMFYGAFSNDPVSVTVREATTALNAVDQVETTSAAQQRVMDMLETANIDISSPLTQGWLAAMSGSLTGQPTGAEGWRSILNLLTGAEGALGIQGFLDQYPEAALTRPTPYSQALEENAFTQSYGALFTPTEQAMTGAREGGSLAPSGAPDYEFSEETGAIRFANGTIVTEQGGIIYDPTADAPGSQSYLRDAATWDEAKLDKWKKKFVALGYMSKEEAKIPGFTTAFRQTLGTYWGNYYVNGGQEIAADAPGGGTGTKPPLIDYQDFSAQIQNDTRDQLRRILGAEPTEEQVRAQTQYVMRTATDLQRKFRGKDYSSPGSMALTEASERAIGNLETSPYAEDVRENTGLRDAMTNAAQVTRSLLS